MPQIDAETKARLIDYLAGRMPEGEALEFESQLDVWEDQLDAIDSELEDDLLGQLRGAELPPRDPPSLRRLIEKVSAIDPTAAGGQPTLHGRDVEYFSKLLAPAELPGELGRLGRFRVLNILGSGGMGVVFEAEDGRLRRKLAIKVLTPTLAGHHTSRERFLREARAVAAIHHDHVIGIHDTGEAHGLPFLVMPLLEGETLARRIAREGRLPLDEALRIGQQVAQGLSAAHQQQCLHRDIKPGNIWLESPDARVKILDFGLARIRDDDEDLTASADLLGTPKYMSPEQVAGQGLDARSDLYSLGVVLYELLTGTSPYPKTTLPAVLDAITNKRPVSPCQVCADVPVRVSEFTMLLLEKDAARRPGTASTVADKLTDLRTNVDALAVPASRKSLRSARHLTLLLAAGILTGAIGGFLAFTIARDEPYQTVPLASAAASPVSPAQEMVDFAVSKSSTCYVERNDGTRLHVHSQAEIPPWPFKLLSIRTNYEDPWSDTDVARIRGLDLSNFLLDGNVDYLPSTYQLIADLPALKELTLSVHSLSDEDLAIVGTNTGVEYLNIAHGQNITDAGVAQLMSMIGLRELHIQHASLTDESVRRLHELGNLKVIQMSRFDLTDEGLEILSRLDNLERIVIDIPRVTDEGLLKLARLPKLRFLQLRQPRQITPKGRDRFKAAMPSTCQVFISGYDT